MKYAQFVGWGMDTTDHDLGWVGVRYMPLIIHRCMFHMLHNNMLHICTYSILCIIISLACIQNSSRCNLCFKQEMLSYSMNGGILLYILQPNWLMDSFVTNIPKNTISFKRPCMHLILDLKSTRKWIKWSARLEFKITCYNKKLVIKIVR